MVRSVKTMLDYFWKFRTDIPQALGTPNFSPTHLSWMVISLFLIVVMLLVYRRLSPTVRDRVIKGIAVLIALLDIARWLWAIFLEHYSVLDMLPLHLCSLTTWTHLAGVFSGKTMFKEFGYALGLPGALAAILTPDWYAYPFLSFQYLQAALIHTLLVLVPVLWVWGDGFRPNWRRLPKLFGLLALYAIPVALINQWLGSNYLFIHWAPKDTPLEIFEKWFGNPGYLVPLVALILVVWAILYLPWAITDRRKRA